MLELQDITLRVGEDESITLLEGINLKLEKGGQLVAVLGPSGCGKSTLMKVIAGLMEATEGRTLWKGSHLGEEGDFEANEIGYVPQFSIAHDKLLVWECIEDAVLLKCAGLSRDEVDKRVDEILEEVGLLENAEKRIEVLSGGQKRRLALGMELVSSPDLLLCDEVTSGLDPRAEEEMTQLMKAVASKGRIVLNITHSLTHLAKHDAVIVLYKGRLTYHGSPEHLPHYFGVESLESLYPRLAVREASSWATSWENHKDSYYMSMREALANAVVKEEKPDEEPQDVGMMVQAMVLWRRRWRLFFRDSGQVKLQLALLFGFPCLVVIFALNGVESLRAVAESSDFLQQKVNDFTAILDNLRVGGMVSGLIMFQVVLLTLMGANNAAREVAGERLILEKEKFSGLSPAAYVLSRGAFLGVLCVIQSVWMSLFVHSIVQLPGDVLTQTGLLVLVNGAMTAVSFGISSVMKNAEQSSLVSVYLVGFQLPLSGAVLALPAWLGVVTRPVIASYWGWAGFLQTLQETRYYDAVKTMTTTPLTGLVEVIAVLVCHIAIGVFVAFTGCRSSRWGD